ncbi:glycosyltransferase [Enterococcus xiangfangensis]|uniref:glycosyltransferase n=1 Tax=Enterococcus xiangfangensis TaxID=1296537 RepID=UPI0010F972D6|nr:glycosyltransferase [Enterococcus xiangfangensis]MBM7712760.1 cellulose synthase/poly-beta-1,6-N-acetylglucosamine synthase-like glycosyltransferase [Enterococcus xiangfangensis]
MKFLFYLFLVLIIYTMIGYPILLEIMNKIVPKKDIILDNDYRPTVTVIVPAHNEESVIEKKILNLLSLNYEDSSLEIIVASDNSTDDTNIIVKNYEIKYPYKIKLYSVKERKGKTNAQDEAVRIAKGDVTVFTDANSMLEKNAINELVTSLSNSDVGYVAGKLVYTNDLPNATSESEASYWNIDLRMRKIESDLASITAGNGSIYAIKKDDYIEIDPIYSHDSVFPPKFVILGKKALYNDKALAFEKAGETDTDEFKRKVRMSRKIIMINFVDLKKYNVFKNGLFTLFYFSHRTLRNNLYLMHLLVFISNLFLAVNDSNPLYKIVFIMQIIIYLIAFIGRKSVNKYVRFISYYAMTISAQLIGAYREISGKSKPFWGKAESTR